MKKTEKKNLIEKMEFDDFAFAKQTFEDSDKKLGRIRTGLIVSAAATLASFIGFSAIDKNDTIGGIFILVALITAIASYIIGGGMKIAFKAAKKLAVFGWFILPFPYDLGTGICTIIIAPIAFLFIPVVFVYINYKQVKRNRDDAEEYMKFCKPVTTVENPTM